MQLQIASDVEVIVEVVARPATEVEEVEYEVVTEVVADETLCRVHLLPESEVVVNMLPLIRVVVIVVLEIAMTADPIVETTTTEDVVGAPIVPVVKRVDEVTDSRQETEQPHHVVKTHAPEEATAEDLPPPIMETEETAEDLLHLLPVRPAGAKERTTVRATVTAGVTAIVAIASEEN